MADAPALDTFVYDTLTQMWVVKHVGKWRVGVHRFAYTSAIIVDDGNGFTYTDRWCYHTSRAALVAALAWEGPYPGTEPEGWHRHPSTGRRRDSSGMEWVRP